MDKKQTRKLIKEKLTTLAPQKMWDFSLRACKQILACEEYLKSQTVMIFLPMLDEIDPRPIAMHAWQCKKRICVPKVISKGLMEPIQITSLEKDLETSPMGISEPTSNKTIAPEDIDFIVVPGLGFDRSGNRLGRGGGFYDRFMIQAENAGAVLCAIGFEMQLLDKFSTEPHDKKIHMLATEKELLRFKK